MARTSSKVILEASVLFDIQELKSIFSKAAEEDGSFDPENLKCIFSELEEDATTDQDNNTQSGDGTAEISTIRGIFVMEEIKLAWSKKID